MDFSKRWHLVSYDICDSRRLQRVHRCISRRGMALQESVFLVCANRNGLTQVLDEVSGLMDLAEDDLRAYPVPHPAGLWLNDAMASPGQPVAEVAATAEPERASLLARLLAGFGRAA